jgi:hypothetical protein
MRRLKGLTVAIAALLAAGWGEDPVDGIENTQRYRAAYAEGRREASRELREGRPTVYTCGLRMALENLDRETGLPYRAIAGCIIDDEIIGRARGHNERIAEHIKAHGPPSSSFKPWEKELFGLKAYFNERLQVATPQPLDADGPALRSPDGRYSVRAVKVTSEEKGRRKSERMAVEVRTNGVAHEPEMVWLGDGPLNLLWGPEGSAFAVLRQSGGPSPAYLALDLRRGVWLRWEASK